MDTLTPESDSSPLKRSLVFKQRAIAVDQSQPNLQLSSKKIDDFQKKVSNFYAYDHGQGNILWVSRDRVDGKDIRNLVKQSKELGRSLHINTGTHGDLLGNIVSKDHPELADGNFIVEDIQTIAQEYNIALHIVSSYSGPICPPHTDVVYAWCYSELYLLKQLEGGSQLSEKQQTISNQITELQNAIRRNSKSKDNYVKLIAFYKEQDLKEQVVEVLDQMFQNGFDSHQDVIIKKIEALIDLKYTSLIEEEQQNQIEQSARRVGKEQLVEKYTNKINHSSNDDAVWLYKGEVLMLFNEYQEAMKAFKEYESKKSNNAVRIVLAELNLKLKQFDDCIIWCNNIRNNECKNFKAHFLIGNANELQGKMKEALHFYNMALQIKSDSQEAIHRRDQVQNLKLPQARGISFLKENKFSESSDEFRKVIKANPNYARGYLQNAIALYQLGKYKDSIYYCDEALKRDPEILAAHYYKGLSYQKIGDHDKAIFMLNKAIDIEPEYLEAQKAKINSQIELKLFEEALTLAKNCVKLIPSFSINHHENIENKIRQKQKLVEEQNGQFILAFIQGLFCPRRSTKFSQKQE